MQQILSEIKRAVHTTHATDIRAAFSSNPGRFDRFSIRFEDMLLDYSKTAINATILGLLEQLTQTAGLAEKRDGMFNGAIINTTEGRPVLHTALRNRSKRAVMVDGRDVMGDIHAVLASMARFSEDIRSGAICGSTGKKITDVVNIDIGDIMKLWSIMERS